MEDAADLSLRRLWLAPGGLRRALQTRRDRLQGGSRSEGRALRAAEAGGDARAAGDGDIEAGAPETNPNLDLRTRLLLLAAREKKEARNGGGASNGGGAAGGGAGGSDWGMLCSAPVVASMQREKQMGEASPSPKANPNPSPNPDLNPDT